MTNLHPKDCRCYACQVTNLRAALSEADNDRDALRELLRAAEERVKELEKDVAAMSAPCSECKCQMRVCMDCAEASIKAANNARIRSLDLIAKRDEAVALLEQGLKEYENCDFVEAVNEALKKLRP